MLPWDLQSVIETVSYFGIFAIIFAETGLLIGFFLPGDSLLFTAGFLASAGKLDIWILVPVCFAAAVLGDACGYLIGKRWGRGLFTREESRLFRPEYLFKAEAFFEIHGGKSIVLARFLPIIRTFVPVVAGIARMPYRNFATYNVAGAAAWAAGLPLLGYFLGSRIDDIDKYLLPIILLIIMISVIPPGIHIWRENGEAIKKHARLQWDALVSRD